MAAFLSPLDMRDLGGRFVLLAPLRYASDVLDTFITVPAGFETDLASIPRGLWNLIPKIGAYDAPAVVHDYLYATNGITRAQADAVLYEAMTEAGVVRRMRWLIYAGVRLGGRRAWDTHRRRDDARKAA